MSIGGNTHIHTRALYVTLTLNTTQSYFWWSLWVDFNKKEKKKNKREILLSVIRHDEQDKDLNQEDKYDEK